MNDKKKLYTFYYVSGIFLLVMGAGGILSHITNEEYTIRAVASAVGFFLGLTFLHRASKIDPEKLENQN